jgi:SAM-dependent methyltransferase
VSGGCVRSIARRLASPRFASEYFVGDGLDVGAGDDGLARFIPLFPGMRSVREWDLADGDAQFLDGVPDASFDFVHSSHSLEHMADPAVALQHWFRVLRPGGHLVVMVPDEDLYEQCVFPSTYNDDHRFSFTIAKGTSWSPKSRNVGDLLKELPNARVLEIALRDATFFYAGPNGEVVPRQDQTRNPITESVIEFIVRKEAA